MNYISGLRNLLLLLIVSVIVGCAGPAKRVDPVNAIALSAPVAPGLALHQVSTDLGVVLETLSENWEITMVPTLNMLEHQAEHEEENAVNAGKRISRSEAMERARRFFQNSKDLYFLNSDSDAHLLFSFAKLTPRQPEPTADHVANSVLAAMAGVTAEGWIKHAESHQPVQVKGAQYAHYFEIDYTKDKERQFFKGLVGYTQPYWFWFYTYDHLHAPQDSALLERIFETFEVRTDVAR
ncbi:MAG: hypothetical protein K0A94_05695 [Desulfuromonadales bacterium]|nr:hypothetical protein [Desulfuromonadales bacterium]